MLAPPLLKALQFLTGGVMQKLTPIDLTGIIADVKAGNFSR